MSDERKRMLTLKSVSINKYKSVQTEPQLQVEPDVTVLVGKNESGKTAILEAVAKTNPQPGQGLSLNKKRDYPIEDYQHIKSTKHDSGTFKSTFLLSQFHLEEVANDIGPDTLNDKEIESEIYYSDSEPGFNTIIIDEGFYFDYLFDKHGLSSESNLGPLTELLSKADIASFTPETDTPQLEQLLSEARAKLGTEVEEEFRLWDYFVNTWIKPHMPRYLYYSDYYQLPSEIDIVALQNDRSDRPELKTARALFELANLAPQDLMSSDAETTIMALEAAGQQISHILGQYWHTNKNLRVKFYMPRNTNAHGNPYLTLRVSDGPDDMTLPLDSRSRGFRWFFSFFVWFSKIQEDAGSQYILLLDEPGLNLHASAQQDLLRFIEDLAKEYQIIYTTHSPFMVESDKLHRVRTVLETETGTRISDSVQEKDPDTLFPLQAALGYDIAQNLFVGKNNLLVEGVSDLTYLQSMSSIIVSTGREALREDITIVPVGGLSKVATFISLLRGQQLNLACLLDSFTNQKGKQRVDDLVRDKIIRERNIRFFDEFAANGSTRADIEDLFGKDEYLKLYNRAFEEREEVKLSDLDENESRIVKQIEKHVGKRYNHHRPANALARLGVDAAALSEATMDRFESMFKTTNRLFPLDD